MIGSFSVPMVCVMVLLGSGGVGVAAQSDDALSRRESMNALRDLTRQLISEAQDAQANGFLHHASPNAAQRTEARIGDAELHKAITERQHRDPFIDAYVRWQLTSFDVHLPEMTPQQFARLMEQAPAMMENPRGEGPVVALFTKANDAGPLAPADGSQLREANRELDRQTQIAEAMNVPAIEYRGWVARQLGDTGPRRLLWMLENCAATVRAAWPPANIKRQISQSFSASVSDGSITEHDHRMIAEQMQRMAGLERQFVNTVTFMADGSVRVTFSTAAITTRDVNNWISRLAGE